MPKCFKHCMNVFSSPPKTYSFQNIAKNITNVSSIPVMFVLLLFVTMFCNIVGTDILYHHCNNFHDRTQDKLKLCDIATIVTTQHRINSSYATAA